MELPWCCRSSVQEAHGILMYLRFMDDGFMVHRGSLGQLMAFTSEMKRRSKFFKLDFEVTRVATSFLDLWVSFGPRFRREGRLDYHVFRKPSAIGSPLSLSSGHHPGIHKSWPKSLVSRTERLCDSRAHRQQQVGLLQAYWHRHGISGHLESRTAPKSDLNRALQVRFILPWLPCGQGFRAGRILREISLLLSAAFGMEVQVLISWRLGGKHLQLALRGFHDELDDNLQEDYITMYGGDRGR